MWQLIVFFVRISSKIEHLHWLIKVLNIIELARVSKIYWSIFPQPHMKIKSDKRIDDLCCIYNGSFLDKTEIVTA